MSSQDRVRRYTRTRRRKPMLDVDLNVVPCESQVQDKTSTHARYLERQEGNGNPTVAATIDLDVYDDDVVISSPRAFAEAKNNCRRKHGSTTVVDLESDERSSHNKRTRLSSTQTNLNVYMNLEGDSNSAKNGIKKSTMPPPPPPKEHTFTCPVCMGPLVEEMSTKCGHIFCKACIKASIAAQSKCPTCRRKITLRDIIRIYLPAANSA